MDQQFIEFTIKFLRRCYYSTLNNMHWKNTGVLKSHTKRSNSSNSIIFVFCYFSCCIHNVIRKCFPLFLCPPWSIVLCKFEKSGGLRMLDGITFRNWLPKEAIMHQLHNYTVYRRSKFVYIYIIPTNSTELLLYKRKKNFWLNKTPRSCASNT